MEKLRTVADLRPRKGVNITADVTVATAARQMLEQNADAILVVSSEGGLVGIFTDSDATRKVLSLGLNPEEVIVTEVMTKQPQCVRESDSAIDALCTMVENRFRHLPVLGGSGEVIGLLDIAKCLYDAISRLERHVSSASNALSSAMLKALPATADDASAMQLVNSMVLKLFSPSLSDLLSEHEQARTAAGASAPAGIGGGETVQKAAEAMSVRRGALIVQSSNHPCAGIITPKDLLFRVVAKGLAADKTEVQAAMTPQPDTMPGSATVLQARVS